MSRRQREAEILAKLIRLSDEGKERWSHALDYAAGRVPRKSNRIPVAVLEHRDGWVDRELLLDRRDQGYWSEQVTYGGRARQVSIALGNLRKQGLAQQDGVFWRPTAKGRRTRG